MSDPHTLVHQLVHWASTTPDRPAIHGRRDDGSWSTWSWADYLRDVRLVARGLLALGHDVGECVAIVGNNRPEWSLAQFGVMACRGIPAPIYPTLTWEQMAFIVAHSQARVAFCDTAEQLDKYLAAIAAGQTPRVEKIVTMDDLGRDDDRVVSWGALLELGRQHPEEALDARLDAMTDSETCLLIYTSGTTGAPKAVELDHGGILHLASGCIDRFDAFRQLGTYRTVSYLPLSHVAEQVFTTFFHLETGGEVYFCPDMKQVKEFLTSVRPTFFAGVPRVWEKFQSVLEGKLAEAGGFKGWLTQWALRTELAAFKRDVQTGTPSEGLGRRLARKLVLSKIHHALGFDNVLVAGTGAAPISVDTLEFFASLGITIFEAYGMSETSGLATIGVPGKPRFGTVGTAVRGVDVRIADDGEVLLKGRNMTRGYLRQPEHTAELLDDDGWLHTGDLGRLDDGFLRITGRKKDLLITAAGKNVAPAEMEGYMKSIPGVSQAVVVGDGKPYLSALVTLDGEALDDLARRVGVPASSLAEMAADERVRAWVMGQVEARCNDRVAQYQTIKKVDVLPVEFGVDTGELTPSMKVKRNVVSERFADRIAALYDA